MPKDFKNSKGRTTEWLKNTGDKFKTLAHKLVLGKLLIQKHLEKCIKNSKNYGDRFSHMEEGGKPLLRR